MKKLFLASAAICAISSPVFAQASADDSEAGSNVIYVSARKKTETDLSVPIAIRAYDQQQLETKGIQSLQDIAATTPSLTVSSAAGNSGGTLTLRGIGTPTAGPGTDQAVALNFDGVTIAEGLAVRLSQFDLAQVEILQGPQSLYYGKNSSGGIISLTTGNPTDLPYAMFRVGYGFQARELLTEAVLSGPIAEGLGARLAFYRSDMDGYFKNPLATQTGTPSAYQLATFGPIPEAGYNRAPGDESTGVRATLQYESDGLLWRTKGTYMGQRAADSFAATQFFHCASGQIGLLNDGHVPGIGDCEINHFTMPVGQNTTAAVGGDPLYGDGTPYAKVDQYLVSNSIDYEVADGITLSSVTGYYDVELNSGEIQTSSPYPVLGSTITVKRDQFTQEFRASTDLDSSVNGMLGVYYERGNFYSTVSAHVPILGQFGVFPGGIAPTPIYDVNSRAYSVFGQITVDLLDDMLEISAGGRYTDEKKDLTVDFLGMSVEDAFARKNVRLQRFTPEVTASFRPTPDTNIFATYKRGTKSGGFNLSALLPPVIQGREIAFDDENAEGFEGGVKSLLADGQIRFDLTGYFYDYKNLQVVLFDPTVPTTFTRNAASARTYGLQFTTNYNPSSVPGLNLSAAINYGNARYRDYIGGCYVGQTQADGCIYREDGTIIDPNAANYDPAERASGQNLGGKDLSAAPDWTGNVSASYDFPVTESDIRLGLATSVTYSDGFEVIYNQTPGSRQRSSTNIDATLRLFSDDDTWELALIGKNLTDQLRVRWAADGPATPSLLIDPLTGASSGTGIGADLIGSTNAPRTFMLRLTLKPRGLFGG